LLVITIHVTFLSVKNTFCIEETSF